VHVVIAGGVTVYALGDMMIHNRRQRAKFFEEQKAKQAAAIYSARQAIDSGHATEEQINFINMEDAHTARLEAERRAKAEKKGIWTAYKEWLFSGLKKEEEGDDVGSSERRLGYEAMSEEDDSLGERESDIVRAIKDEKERQQTGGPLDRLGTETEGVEVDDEKPKSGGWTSFMTRR
jgi:hypothetical protein